jgi:ABC-type amino acid transport substrate-binding protein
VTRAARCGVAACGLFVAALALGAEPLPICMEESNAPVSQRRGPAAGGFDVLLAQALAESLGRPLAIRWFESKYEKEASLALAVNALLSAGVCELVAGYPLYAPQLGAPAAATARTPDYDGARPPRQRPWIRLGSLIASRPYLAAPLTIILAPGARERRIGSLDDLAGMRVLATAGTLADAILRLHRGGALLRDLSSLPQNEDLLAALEQGGHDAAFVELHKFDRHRARFPATQLAPSGFLHPLSFNLGFVALDGERALVASANQALDELQRSGALAEIAGRAGLTYVAPQAPEVRGPITLQSLRGMAVR